MYSYNADISYSQCDCDGKLKLWNLANMFQDCSMKHSESLHVGMKELFEARKVWVLSRWQIVIDRLPDVGQNVMVGTWPTDFNRCIGTRNFVMKDDSGSIIACADSTWAFIDIDSMKPAKVGGRLTDAYTTETGLDMPYDRSRILTENMSEGKAGSFVAGKRYMDTNNHMNNAQYIYKAMEYIPEDMDVAQVRVEYKMSVMRNARVFVRTYSDDDRKYVVTFNNENDKIYALMEFTGRA